MNRFQLNLNLLTVLEKKTKKQIKQNKCKNLKNESLIY